MFFRIKDKLIFYFFIFLLLPVSQPVAQDTVKVMCYNLENYTPADTSRNQYFRTVLSELKPDLLVVEEITSQVTIDIFLNNVLKAFNTNYAAGNFVENTYSPVDTTNNALFYRSDKFDFVSTYAIQTEGIRNIDAYRLTHKNSGQNIILFGVHLKANTSDPDQTPNETKRNNGALSLRSYTDTLSIIQDFIVLGDFNIFSADEPAYQTLTVTSGSGKFMDPINMTGIWNNVAYAQYHTHSTRYSTTYGGLNNRLDLILYSYSISQAGGVDFINNSTVAFGNDGQHYNNSIIYSPPNSTVSTDMVNALYNASDHLPVYALFSFDKPTGIVPDFSIQSGSFILYQNYPNPFNPSTTITYNLPKAGRVVLKLYNALGQVLETLIDKNQTVGKHSIKFNSGDLPSGIYLYRIMAGNYIQSKKMIILK